MKYLLITLIVISSLFLAACGEKTTEITIESGLEGMYSISGKITLPENFKTDAIAFLTYQKVSGDKAPWSQFKRTMINSQTVEYTINKVSDGEYKIKFTVDQNMNQKLSDSGDFEGFYNGKATEMEADLLTISGSSVEGVDFSIATLE